MYAQNPRENTSTKQKFPTTIILVFSLAGLLAGFAFAGFTGTRANNPARTGPIQRPTAVVRSTVTVTPDPTPEDIVLGQPDIKKYTFSEKADGATSYTLSAQAINKSDNTPIQVSDVQCRLWITTDTTAMDTALKANNYALLKNTSDLSQPFPQETAGVNFTTPSTLLQPCAANGPTIWTYTLTPTIQPGTYYIYVLADWKGVHFNWSTRQITVS